MIDSRMKTGAGILCLLYIVVQSFQWWVFSKAPVFTEDGVADFLFSAEPLSVLRSWLMLFSMFGLFFIFFVLCFSHTDKNKAWNVLAFSGFAVFFLLEIMLRSVELFYTQIQLPQAYLASADEANKAIILSYVTQFQKIQLALYFPLGFSQTLGSFILAIVFPASKPNYLIKAACYFNGVRLLLRSITVYLGINLFPSSLYDLLYLPMVYLTFGLMAWWFFRAGRAQHP